MTDWVYRPPPTLTHYAQQVRLLSLVREVPPPPPGPELQLVARPLQVEVYPDAVYRPEVYQIGRTLLLPKFVATIVSGNANSSSPAADQSALGAIVPITGGIIQNPPGAEQEATGSVFNPSAQGSIISTSPLMTQEAGRAWVEKPEQPSTGWEKQESIGDIWGKEDPISPNWS